MSNNEESKSRENEPVVGTLQDYKDLAKSFNQQVCPQCGYCPCCGRPRGNFNYPTYPPYPWPQTPIWTYVGATGGTSDVKWRARDI